MNKLIPAALVLSATVTLLACTGTPPQAIPPQAPFKPTASIQDLMTTIIDPAADSLWQAVSSEMTSKGIEEKQPRTDQEWLAVRRHAVALLDAGHLLMVPGRAVTRAGKATEDAHVDGVSNPRQIRQAIDASPTAFHTSALALNNAAAEALAAIDARDAPRLLAAGAKLDHACEQCHSAFWYPKAARPPSTWPAPLKAD